MYGELLTVRASSGFLLLAPGWAGFLGLDRAIDIVAR